MAVTGAAGVEENCLTLERIVVFVARNCSSHTVRFEVLTRDW